MNDSPYVGPRPFLRSEAGLFFGRRVQARNLSLDWLADRVTVLHGPPAVGKTSLLQAGILPLLEQEPHVVTLRPSRLAPPAPPRAGAAGHNAFVYSVLSDWGAPAAPGTTVAEFLAGRVTQMPPSGRLLAAIDQFEEVYSAFPTRMAEREGLLRQLAAALAEIPSLNLLLVVRDDHLASVNASEALLGVPMNYRRLDGLDERAAAEAVQGPRRGTGRELPDEETRALVDRLRTSTHTDLLGNAASVVHPLVEPLHLQIVCAESWADPGLTGIPGVAQALSAFYRRATEEAGLETGVPVAEVRAWVESAFITEYGTRDTKLRGLTRTADMRNEVADALVARHLLTATTRLRGTWYQLGQDQMIEVVRRAGEGFAEPGPARVPEDAGVFTEAAEAAFGEGNFTGARRLASVAASRYQLEGDTRRQAQAMALHGEIALVEGDLTAARESFRSALNGFESLADRVSTARSLSALANVVATSGDHRAAADLYRQAVEINRTDVEARTGLGFALWRLGSPADAEAEFAQAITARPGAEPAATARALSGRGQVRVDLRLHARALDDLDRALALGLNPEDEADACSARALALAGLGRHDEAAAAMEAALLLAPGSPLTRERAARLRR
ncbi:tetratricopeptide repeat protein [Nonomuraea endophytica]|uniref:Tetratricopeptide (TPR) repeat protein n=1 Tax=Nonomuraea endophytica TaxID=714136 RepID=A0A7W8EMD9_9ACTN|nr:tetratricopeptide repeat protein [Nonomuraea endophytica]MBB5084581.1 tetratricopeptide (TPR) repeat protein [Nonomuraea endophytica]